MSQRLDVHPRSFGFVVFEGPNQILSWGVRSFRPGVNVVKTPAGKKLFTVLDKFTPSAVVIRKRETASVGSGNSEPPIPEILSRFVSSGKVSSGLR